MLAPCSIVFSTNGEYVEVTDVSLGKPDVTDEDDTAYAGPVRSRCSSTPRMSTLRSTL